jgi:hypothetical protein
MLTQCFKSQKVYGRDPDALEACIEMHMMVLADFPIADIERAFILHLRRSAEMPTPSDIASLIERRGKPPLERSVYISISRKDGADLTPDDWQYLRDYEHFAKTGEVR